MLTIGAVVLTTDPAQAGSFWSRALGYSRTANPAYLAPSLPGAPHLHLDATDRTHLDLWTENAEEQRTVVDRLISLGATRVAWEYPDDADFVVLADPAGSLFCVVSKDPTTVEGARERMRDEEEWLARTERLAIRRGRAEDADVTWPWRQAEETNRWLTSVPASTQEHRDRWLDKLEHTVVAEMDGRIVATGKVELEEAWAQADVAEQARGSQVEIGWVVSPDHQGQGIGTEFARALLGIAFASGARRVTAYCFADNIASARIMEKIGMHREAHFRADSLHRSGAWLDSLVYAALDTDPR
ncbi:GNAT family N-acetyltransferase [Luteococcus peritonei]|uniref:GNAT family N-acetyltransferase n=1 Tax=Luteococcus peritonei TaxID=88874 RepID=A0ABW4RSV7_9ACTN